jgi:hypothetical protein
MFLKDLRTWMSTIAVLVTACCSVANAAGPAVPYQDSTSGQMTSIVVDPDTGSGHFEFEGIGKGSHIGNFSITGGHDFDADGNVIGSFTQTTPGGSTLSGIYYGESFPIGGNLFQFEVTVIWIEGTGRLEGVTGELQTVAILDMTNGEVTYESEGFWVSP